ncbi:MAG: ABC transporter permease, partial [Cytophagales bacterium]
VLNYCRVVDQSFVGGVVTVSDKTNSLAFSETRVAYADGNFFDIFTFPITNGSSESLKEPNTIAISLSAAKKYFKQQEALGKILMVNNEFGSNLYKVIAVFKDFPANSDLQYDFVLSLQTLASPVIMKNNSWASLDGNSSYLTTYLTLHQNVDVISLEQKINKFKATLDPDLDEKILLQPLTYMHLAKSFSDPQLHTGNLGFVYLLSAIAILILVIGWFNYVNLNTATSLKRAKEVGLRKVAGANRYQLVTQFLGESFSINLISLFLALVLVNVFQFFFNQFLGKNLSLGILGSSSIWLWGVLLLTLGTVASGTYTAFVLTSITPSKILKGVFSKSSSGLALRKVLVVFQFSISALLIASTVIMSKQLHFMRNEKLGMNIDQLLVISPSRLGWDSTFAFRKESFKNKLAELDFVKAYCATANVPSQGYNYTTEGITKLKPQRGDEKLSYSVNYIDERYFMTYEIPVVAGKNFTAQDCQQVFGQIDKVILNERAAHQLGFENTDDAIGKKIKWNDAQIEVYGVVKDYHHQSFKEAIRPIIFVPQAVGSFYTIRLTSEKIQDHIAYIKKAFLEYFPGNPFDYFFVNENFNRQYQTEEQNQRLFITASSLAIFIACLGLFGLAMFSAEQRTKEIGIKKVLGANVSQIVVDLSKDFLLLVLVAIFISSPIAWWALSKWLQQFAYRTEITAWVFVVSGTLAMLIALLTIVSQAISAARANPVDSLHSE